jgi:hypothetical protein
MRAVDLLHHADVPVVTDTIHVSGENDLCRTQRNEPQSTKVLFENLKEICDGPDFTVHAPFVLIFGCPLFCIFQDWFACRTISVLERTLMPVNNAEFGIKEECKIENLATVRETNDMGRHAIIVVVFGCTWKVLFDSLLIKHLRKPFGNLVPVRENSMSGSMGLKVILGLVHVREMSE